jgi:hypothetical protein
MGKKYEPERKITSQHNLQSFKRTTNERSVDVTTPGLSRYKSANVTTVLDLLAAVFSKVGFGAAHKPQSGS